MKALSIRQPWVWAIMNAGKRIENREKWRGCNYRGPILIHASAGVGGVEEFDDNVVAIRRITSSTNGLAKLERRRPGLVWCPGPLLPRGGIVGRARIDGVLRTEDDFAAYAANVVDGEAQRAWWFGGFALVLADVEPLPFTRCKGALGLFEVPDEVVGRVNA